MATEIKIIEEAAQPLSMHPKKFALWLFMVSVCMVFAGWTSAYIVKRGDGGWSEIIVPDQFWINTVIIVVSSMTMIWARQAAKRDNIEMVKVALTLTAVLGLFFLGGQLMAWGKMVAINEHFSGGNVSHSFMYVLTGFHGLHIISGVIFLLIVLNSAFKYRIHSKNMAQIEMCAMYWHFLDVLWLYLFVFLLLNR